MNEWITDRVPVKEDADYGIQEYDGLVFATDSTGQVTICSYFWAAQHGFPWQPIMIPEPYVMPKRFRASWDVAYGWWRIERNGQWFESLLRLKEHNDQHREAAERIAAIYEEVMP